MSTIRSIGFILIAIVWWGCKDKNPNNNIIPNVPVSLVINTNLPQYFPLKNLGNFVYMEGGHRGIIVMHNYDGYYYAFDRACTYHPDDDCGVVEVDSSNIRFRCGSFTNNGFEECCSSKYQFDGLVTAGPAQFPLRSYSIQVRDGVIYVNN